MDSAIIGLLGIVIGVVLKSLIDARRDSKHKERRQAYLAIRVTCILDRFADGCVDIAIDKGYPQGDPARYEVVPQYQAPKIEFDQLDVDWQSLPPKLAYDILSIPNMIHVAEQIIDSVIEYQDSGPEHSEFFTERQYQYAKLGQSAVKTASKLRKITGLDDRPKLNWEPDQLLQGVIDKYPAKPG